MSKLIETPKAGQFHETETFDGVLIPRFDSQPDGPKMKSMGRCVCGALWNKHRFVDGACPVKQG